MEELQGRRHTAATADDIDVARDVAATATAIARILQAALTIKKIHHNQLTDDSGMSSGCGE